MSQPIHPYMVYSTKEAAELLGINLVTVQRYIRSRKLKASRLGKIYKITGQALLDLMALSINGVQLSQDRVRQVENSTYIKSRAFSLNSPDCEKYLLLIDMTNNLLIILLDPDIGTTEDHLTLKYIGSRLFNSGLGAFHNGLSGYYQNSFSLQRDIIEIQFLLDLFKTYPHKIKEWRNATDKVLKENFSPATVRILLDNRDGFEDKRRAAIYQQYCKYATHVTYAGFTMLTNDSNQVEIGSFYNEKKLLNCMHDLALHYSYAVMHLVSLVQHKKLTTQKLAVEHMKMFHETFKEVLPVSEEIVSQLSELERKLDIISSQAKII